MDSRLIYIWSLWAAENEKKMLLLVGNETQVPFDN